MPRKVSVNNLSTSEQEAIIKVIQRDLTLRKNEDSRLEKLNQSPKSNIDSTDSSKCIACGSSFFWLLNPKSLCNICKNFYCKSNINCGDTDESKFAVRRCALCRKTRDIELMSHEWYYSQLRSRFRRHGGAKILRELYKKRREEPSALPLHDIQENDGANLSDEDEREKYIYSDKVGAEIKKAVNKILLPKLEEMKDSQKWISCKEQQNEIIDELLEKFLQEQVLRSQNVSLNSALECAGRDVSSPQSFLHKDAEIVTEISDSDFESFPSRTESIRFRSSSKTPFSEQLQQFGPESSENFPNSQEGNENKPREVRGTSREQMIAKAEVHAAMAQILERSRHDEINNQAPEFSTELAIKAKTPKKDCHISLSRHSSSSEKNKCLQTTTSSMDEFLGSSSSSSNDSFSNVRDIVITAVKTEENLSSNKQNNYSTSLDRTFNKAPQISTNLSSRIQEFQPLTAENDLQPHPDHNHTHVFDPQNMQNENDISEQINKNPRVLIQLPGSSFSEDNKKPIDSSSSFSSNDSDENNSFCGKPADKRYEKNVENKALGSSSTFSSARNTFFEVANQNLVTRYPEKEINFENIGMKFQTKQFDLTKQQDNHGEAAHPSFIDDLVQAQVDRYNSEISRSSTTSSTSETLHDKMNKTTPMPRKLSLQSNEPNDQENVSSSVRDDIVHAKLDRFSTKTSESSTASSNSETLKDEINKSKPMSRKLFFEIIEPSNQSETSRNRAETSGFGLQDRDYETSFPVNTVSLATADVSSKMTSFQQGPSFSSSSLEDDSRVVITKPPATTRTEVDSVAGSLHQDVFHERQRKSIDDVLNDLQNAGLLAKKVKFNRASLNSSPTKLKSAYKFLTTSKQDENFSGTKTNPEKPMEWKHYSFTVDPGREETQKFIKKTSFEKRDNESLHPIPSVAQRRSLFSNKPSMFSNPIAPAMQAKAKKQSRKTSCADLSSSEKLHEASVLSATLPTQRVQPISMTGQFVVPTTTTTSDLAAHKVSVYETKNDAEQNDLLKLPFDRQCGDLPNAQESQSLQEVTTKITCSVSASTSSSSSSSSDSESLSKETFLQSSTGKTPPQKSWYERYDLNLYGTTLPDGTASSSSRVLKRSLSSNSTEDMAFVRGFIEIEKANSPNSSFRASTSSLDKIKWMRNQTSSRTSDSQFSPRTAAPDHAQPALSTSPKLSSQDKLPQRTQVYKTGKNDGDKQSKKKSKSKPKKSKKNSSSFSKTLDKNLGKPKTTGKRARQRNPFVIEI